MICSGLRGIFPFLVVFAVANTALINMLMASRLLYGPVRYDVVLRALTWLTNRGVRAQRTGFRDIEHMEDEVR